MQLSSTFAVEKPVASSFAPPIKSVSTTAVAASPASQKPQKYKRPKIDDWAPKNKIGAKGRHRDDLVFREIDIKDHLLQSKLQGLKADIIKSDSKYIKFKMYNPRTKRTRTIFFCKFNCCGRMFPQWFEIQRHLKAHESVLDKLYTCQECGLCFSDAIIYRKHLKECEVA